MVIENNRFAAVLALVAIVSFSLWPMWKWLSVKSATAAQQARVQALVDKNASLKPALKIAMMDGVLTEDEARGIVEGAGEKLETAK